MLTSIVTFLVGIAVSEIELVSLDITMYQANLGVEMIISYKLWLMTNFSYNLSYAKTLFLLHHSPWYPELQYTCMHACMQICICITCFSHTTAISSYINSILFDIVIYFNDTSIIVQKQREILFLIYNFYLLIRRNICISVLIIKMSEMLISAWNNRMKLENAYLFVYVRAWRVCMWHTRIVKFILPYVGYIS